MHPLKWHPMLAAALACAIAGPLPSAQPAQPVSPDWSAVAGTYPALGTLASKEELAILHWLQDTRTRADVARVGVESHPDLDQFLAAIGSPSDASAYPGTVALLKQAKDDMKEVVRTLKTTFGRPRPYTTDPTLTPALPPDGSFSFPSKHATEGILFASILIRLDPPDQTALLEEGRLIGDDRPMAGLHWPSDVTAGQRLGRAYAAYWLALPENAGLFQAAYGEWSQAQAGGNPN